MDEKKLNLHTFCRNDKCACDLHVATANKSSEPTEMQPISKV